MAKKRFLTARWVELEMLNYEVEPRLLERWVPAGTELDSFEGRTFVSLVGFLFLETRVRGWAIPGHRDFEEVNLRLYVRRRVGEEVRRGVVFVKEIVPKPAIAWTARTFYGERYVSLPMQHSISPRQVEYRWRLGERWNRLSAERSGEPSLPAEGSIEQFISEHYWGYAAQRDGGTVEYRVEHPSWRVWRAQAATADIDVERLYGAEFRDALRGKPASAFIAEGSEVAVMDGVRIC